MQMTFGAAMLLAGVYAQVPSGGYSFDYTDAQAQISIQLSQNAYCGKEVYLTQEYTGAAEGFVPTKIIYNFLYDVQGFVGYLPSDNSIYVSYRGSESIQNWVTNLDATQSEYEMWPECDCFVHSGFQKAMVSVQDDVLAEVERLMALHPSYSVKTTGHSLGGALALMNAMALLKSDIDVTMINFGQPRTGDSDFADFAMSKLSHYRVTHYKDPVPNIPPQWPTGYHHTAYEIFEYEATSTAVKQCDSTGEDPHCTDKWIAFQYNVDDHLVYLGMCMGMSCGTCPNSLSEEVTAPIETSSINDKLNMAAKLGNLFQNALF